MAKPFGGSGTRIWCRALLLLALVALAHSQRLADADLWGHLTFGRDYLRAGHILTRDPYSYTAQGNAWHGHEALFEISFWLAYDSLGTAGLVICKTALGLIALLLVWLSVRDALNSGTGRAGADAGVTLWIEAIVVLLTAHLVACFFQVRPQLYTYLGMALLTWILYGSRTRWQRKKLLLIPPIACVWANAHGGFVAGLGLCGIYFGAGVVEYVAVVFTADPEDSDARAKRRAMLKWLVALGAASAAGALATLLNPIGINLWKTVWRALRNPLTDAYITEWRPVPIPPETVQETFYCIHAVALLLLIAAGGVRKRTVTDLVLAASGVLLALTSHRHVPLFAVMVAPVLARALRDAMTTAGSPGARLLRKPVQTGLLAAALAPAVICIARSAFYAPPLSLVVRKTLPVNACSFIREARLKGNIYCVYNWGEYLIWQLGDRCRVGKDGRYDTVYPMDVVRNHLRFLDDTQKGKAGAEALKVPELYDTHMILIETERKVTRWLLDTGRTAHLKHDWTRVYSDRLASVFIRRDLISDDKLRDLKKLAARVAVRTPETEFPTLLKEPAEVPLERLLDPGTAPVGHHGLIDRTDETP